MHRKARHGRRRAPSRKAPTRTAASRRAASRTTPSRSPVATAAGVLGELMLTAGVLVLLFVVYTLWGTGIQTAAAQEDLREQFELQAPAPPPDQETEEVPDQTYEGLELGDAYGILRIQRFGENWEWLVVEGVEDADLKNGPGHYLDSVNPGQLGNVSIAAHRSGHGEPFAKFPELREGDIVEIETHTGIYRYRLDDAPNGDPDGNRIEIRDSWVVDPVPGESQDAEPTEARMTLTTCWPRFGSSHRMYATGVLVKAEEY